MFENLDKHPSYGMLGFRRRSNSGRSPLFGSSVQHKDTIVMTLKHAEMERNLNYDHYFGRGIIAEAEMSYSQFAETIAAMNVSDGIPVTIRYTEKDGRIQGNTFMSKQDQFECEFADHLSEIKWEVKNIRNEVSEIFETKKAIGKADRELILKKLDRILMEVGSNTEFIYSQFNEQMDKTVMEAKGEVEAFVQNKMNSIALAAIAENKGDFKKLESPITEIK